MPKTYEEVANSFEVPAPTDSSPDTRRQDVIAALEEKKGKATLGSHVRDFVRLGIQGATFGLAPKLVRAMGTQEDENEYLQEIANAKENLGAVGDVADFAGSMATPIPGLGLAGKAGKGALALGRKLIPGAVEKAIPKVIGTTAARIGGKALESAAEGAGIGGAMGAAREYGQTPTDMVTGEGILEGAEGGIKAGATIGGIARGAGEMLKAHSANVRAAAAGGDVGTIRRMAKKNVSARAGLTDLNRSLETGEQLGLIGNVGPGGAITAKGVNENANILIDELGGKLQDTYKAIDDVAAKFNTNIRVNYVKKVALDKMLADAGATLDAQGNIVGNNLSKDMLSALSKVQNNVDTMFVNSGQKTTLQDLWTKKQNLGMSIHGIRGNDPVSTLADVYLKSFQSGVDDVIRMHAEKVSPKLSADLSQLNNLYHSAKIIQGMSQQGAESNAGRHYFGLGMHGLTSALGMQGAASMLEKLAPEAIGKDPVLGGVSRAFGALSGLRGPAANLELAAAKAYGKLGPSFGKASGIIGGRVGASHTPAETRASALDALLNKDERKPINYSPRSPLRNAD